MSDRLEKAQEIVAMADTLGRKISGLAQVRFTEALDDLTPEEVKEACRQWLVSSKWMPTPAELRGIAGKGVRTLEQEAALAFTKLDEALEKGSTRDLEPEMQTVVKLMGGFGFLHKVPLKEFRTWKRREFIDLFCAVLKDESCPELVEFRRTKYKQLPGTGKLLGGMKVVTKGRPRPSIRKEE